MRAAGVALVAIVVAGCGGTERPEEPRLTYVRNVAGETRLVVVAKPGGATTELTQGSEDINSPVWSPDGTQIAFVTSADHGDGGWERSEIAVMPAGGGEPGRLTDDDEPDIDPHWTPDGRIAFTHCTLPRQGFPRCTLETIEPDGDDRRTAVDELGPTFGARLAPDGKAVVLARFDRRLRGTIVVRDLESGEERRLGPGEAPSWSPDGGRIAFLTDRDGNGACLFHDCAGSAPELYVVDRDGKEPTRLTRNPESDGSPSWTPDGEWILFSRIPDDDADHDLYAVRSNGRCEVQVTDTRVWELSPAWLGPSTGLAC